METKEDGRMIAELKFLQAQADKLAASGEHTQAAIIRRMIVRLLAG